MLPDDVGQALDLGRLFVHQTILQVGQPEVNHSDVFVDCLVGAHPKIAHSQPRFQIDVVGLAAPAMGVNLESGLRLLTESLALMRAHWGNPWTFAWRLEGFAGLAALQGQPERAARLFGAAQAALDMIGAALVQSDRAEYDRHLALARNQLSEDAFASAWDEGRAMTLDEAIDYALETTSDQ